MRVIILSKFKLEERHHSLLSKGLFFSPVTSMDEFTVYKDINLFLRKVVFQLFHAGQKTDTPQIEVVSMTAEEKELHLALENLMALLDEQADSFEPVESDKFRRPSDLRIKSLKMPPTHKYHWIRLFLDLVKKDLKNIDWKKTWIRQFIQ